MDEGNLDALRQQLEEERELRLSHEDALCDALDEVRRRSASLQLRLEQHGGTLARDLLASPKKLQSILNSEPGSSATPEAEGSSSSDAMMVDSASAPTRMESPGVDTVDSMKVQALASARYIASLEQQLADKTDELERVRTTAEQQRAEHTVESQRVSARSAASDAALKVLCKLLERTTRFSSRGAGDGSDSERHDAAVCHLLEAAGMGAVQAESASSIEWIERCERVMLAWFDAEQRRRAADSLREEQLLAECRDAQSGASESSDAERRRAERAEGRCRELVGALRTTIRDAVDTEEAYQLSGRSSRHRSHAQEQQTRRHAVRRHVRNTSALWSTSKAQEYEDVRADAALRAFTQQALRDQLNLPHARAGHVPTRYDRLLGELR